jgi:hypothetical protein
MSIAAMIQRDFPEQGKSLSGLGGVNTGRDAAEFILLGSNTVQVRRSGRPVSIAIQEQGRVAGGSKAAAGREACVTLLRLCLICAAAASNLYLH